MAGPAAVAKALGVSPNTVRNLSAEFRGFLSPGANPARGERRSYSAEDAAVLRAVVRLRGESLGYAAIRESLAQGYHLVEEDEPLRAAEVEASGGPLVPMGQLRVWAMPIIEERDRLLEERERLQRENSNLQREIGHLEGILEARGRVEEKASSPWWRRLFRRGP